MNIDAMAKELAADFGDDFGKVSQKSSKTVITTVFGYIADQMAEGNELTIPGFGKFLVNDRPERQGRNPKTGETMTIAAKKVIKFTPAKALKDQLLG